MSHSRVEEFTFTRLLRASLIDQLSLTEMRRADGTIDDQGVTFYGNETIYSTNAYKLYVDTGAQLNSGNMWVKLHYNCNMMHMSLNQGKPNELD